MSTPNIPSEIKLDVPMTVNFSTTDCWPTLKNPYVPNVSTGTYKGTYTQEAASHHKFVAKEVKNTSYRPAGFLRKQGMSIPAHIKDEEQLTLETYLDISGNIKVDVVIPTYRMSLVSLELFEDK